MYNIVGERSRIKRDYYMESMSDKRRYRLRVRHSRRDKALEIVRHNQRLTEKEETEVELRKIIIRK